MFKRTGVAEALVFVALALLLGLPAFAGWTSFGDEYYLDLDPFSHPDNGALENAPFDDHSAINVDYPRELAFARGLRKGRVDLWNPLASGGAPLWAEQGGPFFPTKLIYYLWMTHVGYEVSLLSRLVVAAAGAYLLARERGVSRFSSAVAGVIYGFGGCMLSVLPFANASAPAVLPWLVLGAYQLGAGKRWGWLLAILSIAAAASSGHPGVYLVVLMSFGLVLVGQLTAGPGVGRIRFLWQALVCGLLGLALAAPSILPLAELTSVARSYKSGPMGEAFWLATANVNRAVAPISMLIPSALPTLRATLNWFPACIAGAISVLAVCLAACARKRDLDAPVLVLLVAGAVFTFGLEGPWLAAKVPGFINILPRYGWPPLVLAIAQLAGSSLEHEARTACRRLAWAGPLVLVTGGLFAIWVFRHTEFQKEWLVDWLRERPHQLRVLAHWVFPVLVAPAVFVLFRKRPPARLLQCGAATVILLELSTTVVPMTWNPPGVTIRQGMPRGTWDFRKLLHDDGQTRMAGIVGTGLTPMLYKLNNFAGVAALPIRRYAEYPGIKTWLAMQEVTGAPSAFTDLAAIRYIVTGSNDTSLDKLPKVHTSHHLQAFRRDEARARARLVHRVLNAADQKQAKLLLSTVAGALAAGKPERVVLEPHGGNPEHVPEVQGPDDKAVIVDPLSTDVVEIDVRAAAPSYLVLADTYYPGWHAYVDGERTTVYPADLAFRAVKVPAGEHRVVFKFESRPFRAGVGLFAVAALLCAAEVVRRRRVERCASP